MPRLTITLPHSVYNRLSSIALQCDDSMSAVINRLILMGMHYADSDNPYMQNQHMQNQPDKQVEQHCHQLIIQMNALIKNIAAEMLKFNQDDFEQLRQAALMKYNEVVKVN